ncbi:hypothetical protein AURDEDRAFT_96686 [Auricularia subglabra TFB-10046 SS5]|nr:hypothetical protein AURDEDRAFT_96686 [Auricularia subglabra TFB-10046 SS5]
MLGAALLLPWNAMITATSYFQSRLASRPDYRDKFSYTLSTTLTTSNLIFLLHATLTSKSSPLTRRLRASSLVITAFFAFFSLTALVPIPPVPFFYVILVAGAVQAAAGSYLNTAVFALGSLFGPLTLQAAMAGQAAAGILVSIVQLATTYSALRRPVDASEDSAGRGAFWFFSFSTVFMLVSLAGHTYVARQRAYQRVLEPFEAMQSGPRVHGADKEGLQHIGRVAKANLIYNATVAYVFVVTLSVFPAITASVKPSHPAPDGTPSLAHPYMFTALHFLLFNIGDWLGRYLCSFPRFVIWNGKVLAILAVIRTLFIPLFLSCNFGTAAATGASDVWFFVLVLALGTSNGWLSSLCMMSAPDIVHNPRLAGREDVDTAATIASFCLVGGLSLGSIVSFGVSAFVR